MKDYQLSFLMANMFVAVHGRWEISLFLCLFWTLVGIIRYYQECKTETE